MDRLEILKSRVVSTIIKLLQEYDVTFDEKRKDYIKACLCTLDTVAEEIKAVELLEEGDDIETFYRYRELKRA